MGCGSTDVECRQVVLHGNAVESDRLLQRGQRNRDRTALEGVSQQHDVGGGRGAEQRLGHAVGIHRRQALDALAQALLQIGALASSTLGQHELGGWRNVGVCHRQGVRRRHQAERFPTGGGNQIGGQQQIGRCRRDAGGGRSGAARRNAHMAEHRAALLRQTGHIQRGGALAVEVCSSAQQLRDGHHASAADAGDQDVGGIGLGWRGWQVACELVERRSIRRGALQFGAAQRHKRGAEASQARQIDVAGALVDAALGAVFRVERHDGDAIRLPRTVPAAFAYRVVDDDAHIRFGCHAALAAAAQLGGAGLFVDQHRAAGRGAQLALHGVEPTARRHREGSALMPLWIVAHHAHRGHALGAHLGDDVRHCQRTVHRLSAGHRDGIVGEHFVGDVDARRHGSADSQNAGMEIGAVAQVHEDVLLIRERRLADPVDAFRAHVRHRAGGAPHPLRHVVAADAGAGTAAFGHARGDVVRTTRAEQRLAGFFRRHRRHRRRSVQSTLHGIDFLQVAALRHLRQHIRQGCGDGRDIQRARSGQRLALAYHFQAVRVEQDHFQLIFHECALFLDHQQSLGALGDASNESRVQRPRHADLHQAHPGCGDVLAARQAESGERFAHIVVGLAGGHHYQVGRIGRGDDAVDAVGGGKGHREALLQRQPGFLLQRRVVQANVRRFVPRGTDEPMAV